MRETIGVTVDFSSETMATQRSGAIFFNAKRKDLSTTQNRKPNKVVEKGTLSNSFYEASITLALISDKDNAKEKTKEQYPLWI